MSYTATRLMSGPLSIVAALALAHQCAAAIAPETILSIAETESGLNPLSIHDNATGHSYAPASANEAIAIATDLIVSQHHSVDLGLMQINSANLAISNLDIAHAFDACRSMDAGAHIFFGAFHRAVQAALSTYNTGDQQRGIDNGYVARVEAAAAALPIAESIAPAAASHAPPASSGLSVPAGWDVFAQSGGAQFVFTSNGATVNAR
jgi:type IV secretion system protein VirB1